MRKAPETVNLRGFTSQIERQFEMSKANCTLSQDYLKSILKYDPETGLFTWLRGTNKTPIGSIAGTKNHAKVYVTIKIDDKQYKAHRLAWFYTYGTWPEFQIDHINGVKNDNKIKNLRVLQNKNNCLNRHKANTQNKTGFLGVSAEKGKFRADLQIDGKRHFLGYFDAPEIASMEYNKRKSEMTCFYQPTKELT
jgi:HNH endonuclease